MSNKNQSPDPGDIEPNVLIEKMVANDHKQNKRLSAKLSIKNKSQNQDCHLDEPKRVTKIRYLVCTLGLLSLVTSQMSRMVLNLTITQMVDPSMLEENDLVDDNGSCPWPEEELVISEQMTTTLAPPVGYDNFSTSEPLTTVDEMLYFEDVGPVYNSDGDDYHENTDSNATQKTNTSDTNKDDNFKVVDRFKWTVKQQHVLLGGFYYSYFVFMVLGGRLAEIHGAKYVLLLSGAGSALINLATPWMARTNFVLLLLSRIVMGAIQAGVFPGMYALIAKWLTEGEASIYAPLIKTSLRLGMVLGSLVPGLFGLWPNIFYFTGALGTIWSILWLLIATSAPAQNSWVSEDELKHILETKKTTVQLDDNETQQTEGIELVNQSETSNPLERKTSTKTTGAPWLKIITAPPVIGLVVAKLSFNYAIDFLAIELPSYLKYVHHVTKGKMSAITTSMFLIQVLLIVFVGWLAKVMVKKHPFGMSKTTIRKLFQSTASFGVALTMFLITFNDCNLIYVAVLLQLCSLFAIFTAGSESILPYDLSDEYPATIMAIANSVANLSAITTTTLAGLILGNQGGSYDRWNILIYLIVGANLIGGSVFVWLVNAEPIDFHKRNEPAHSGPPPSAGAVWCCSVGAAEADEDQDKDVEQSSKKLS